MIKQLFLDKIIEYLKDNKAIVILDLNLKATDGIEFLKRREDTILKQPDYLFYYKELDEGLDSLLSNDASECQFSIPIIDFNNIMRWLDVKIQLASENGKRTYVCSFHDVTDYKSLNISLGQQVKQLESTINKHINLTEETKLLNWFGVFSKDGELIDFSVNNELRNYFGFEEDLSKSEMLRIYKESIVSGPKDDYISAIKSLKVNETTSPWILNHNINGLEVTMEHSAFLVSLDDNDTIWGVSGQLKNITEARQTFEKNIQLSQLTDHLIRADKLAIKSGKVMVWFQDNDAFDMVEYFYGNELFISKLGLETSDNGLITRESFHKTVVTSDQEGRDLYDAYFKKVRQIAANEFDGFQDVIVKHRNIKTGEIIYCEHSSEVEARYPNGDVKIDGGFIVDVTERVKNQKQMEYIANHDLLTGLYNRNYIESYLKNNMLADDYVITLCDLDGLKLINDAFGHLEGDMAIKCSADSLIRNYTQGELIARMGGDEFLVISTVLDEDYHNEKQRAVHEDLKSICSGNKYEFDIAMGHFTVIDSNVSYNVAYASAENIMYRRKFNERHSRKSKILETILDTLNARTVETFAHSQRMAKHARLTLKALGHNKVSDSDDVALLAKVHDIGKITVPDKILNKNGRLTDAEHDVIKKHAESGYKIVKNIVNSDKIADGVLYHHERFDGMGYPYGLKGEDIPLFARIISVCDVFDVIVTGRVYSEKRTVKEAIDEIIRCKGTQFDPLVVDAFLSIIDY